MSAKEKTLEPEIAHILSIDVVGYSTLLVNEQVDLLKELKRIVRETPCACNAEASGRLIRLPTGDGMVLVFFRSPEEPLQCAVEISEALQKHPKIRVRMGAHSGPVNKIEDVNDRVNVAGAGINIAQRVLDCGDGGHILLSKRLADDLSEYGHWRPHLHDLGECIVKHGVRIHLVNFHRGPIGNPNRPKRLQKAEGLSVGARKEVDASRRKYLWASGLAAMLLGAAVLSFIFLRSAPNGSAAIPEKSIAVLPFQSLSDDSKDSYFADGVQGEILSHLAKVADLKVTGRTSVMKYRADSDLDLKKVAGVLGVKYFLEGRIQRSGGRVRVNAELINALTGSQLWADTYDRGLADVFAIQTEIAERIVSELKAKFTPEEKAEIEDRPTTDLAAYELYVRGKAMIARVVFESSSIDNLREAAQLLTEATVRDPSFFLAYCQLANAHDQIYFYGLDATSERLALAQAAVDAATRLRPDFGETHLASARHYYFGYRDYDRAREELAIAARKLPNDPLRIALTGYIDRRQGRWPSSTQHLEHAVELDPRNLVFLKQLALSYNALHRYAEMRAILDRALAIAPDDPALLVQRGVIDLEAEANTSPMRQAIETILARNPAAGGAIADRWVILSLCEGDMDSASRAVAVMRPHGAHEEGLPYPKSWIEGLIARQRNDLDGARSSFIAARAEVAGIVQGEPDSAEAWSALGMIDAALGDKENAAAEGRRAVELLPSSKDAIVGSLLLQNLATIYAWTGQKAEALAELRKVVSRPCYLSYGQLLLYPLWAPLRDEPGFKEIVSSLASSSR